jgi:hypothetical protein
VSKQRWAQEFEAVAQRWWTEERTLAVTAGKKLPFLPGPSAVLLRALGLLHTDASMPPKQVRKYRQVNHMLAVLRPSLRELAAAHPVVRLVDAGCGRSYLTLLIAWWFRHVEHHPVQLLGIDRREALTTESRRRAELVGLDDILLFQAADLRGLDLDEAWQANFGARERPHGVISLHACDTATDEAIALGLAHEVELIAVAPCCQAELATAWQARAHDVHPLAPLWSTPTLRREAAATLTDALRTQFLRAMGYDTMAVEFVGAEHTVKNTLIRAIRRGGSDAEAWAAFEALKHATGDVSLALERAVRLAAHDPGDTGAAEVSRC